MEKRTFNVEFVVEAEVKLDNEIFEMINKLEYKKYIVDYIDEKYFIEDILGKILLEGYSANDLWELGICEKDIEIKNIDRYMDKCEEIIEK
jgi:hypothetical protein